MDRGALLPAKTSQDVHRVVSHLYGAVDLRTATGLLHVVSTFEDTDGTLRALRIGEAAPGSETDFFVLNLARARADAIITTGQILRDEPTLRYDLQGSSAQGLAAWRREVLGKTEPPHVIVLTSAGTGLTPEHPTFHSWARPVVFTSKDGADHFADSGRLELVRDEEPSLAAVCDWAEAHGFETISVEAGPSTARQLYADPGYDLAELMLSVFEGEPAAEARGGEVLTRRRLQQTMTLSFPAVDIDEPSGPWRFERWVATSAAR
jgi:riboflavin biosynthesis pyrimidine reductase